MKGMDNDDTAAAQLTNKLYSHLIGISYQHCLWVLFQDREKFSLYDLERPMYGFTEVPILFYQETPRKI